MISEITFEEIKPMWERLWLGRDDIRSMSSMTDNVNYDYEIYKKYEPVFFGFFTDDDKKLLIGVNSGHPTSETRFRSRGLYVKPGYGGKGIGQLLLRTTIDYAQERDFEVVWSLPRVKAFKTYAAVGFTCESGEETHGYTANGVIQHIQNTYAEKKLK